MAWGKRKRYTSATPYRYGGPSSLEFKQVYESVGALMDACDRAYNEGHVSATIGKGNSNDGSWIGRYFKDWDEIKKAVAEPWQDGLDLVQGMIHEIQREGHTLPPPVDRRRKRVFSPDTGDDVDLDRMRSGQEEYWVQTRRLDLRGPQVITLVANVSTSSYRSHADILWRGAAMIVLSDLLESAGYRTELWAVETCTNSFRDSTYNQRTFTAANLKRAQDPLDVSPLVTAVSGWFFRTVFGFQAKHVARRKVSPGYGSPILITDRNEDVLELVGANTKTVVIDGVWGRGAALAKAREVIEEVNTTETGGDEWES